MRVVIAHELYPPDIAGGGERVVQSAAEGLARMGVEVAVVTTGDPSIDSYNGIRTRRLRCGRYAFNLAAWQIAREAADADVIQTFTYHACVPALLAGRIARKPVVMVCLGLFGDTWLGMRGRFAGRLWRAWERFLMTRPYDRVFFLSEFSRDFGLRMGIPAEFAFVNPPGVNVAAFSPAERKSGVLFVGKLQARKGVDIVLNVARALPSIPFRLVGWGEDRDRLRSSAPANVEVLDMPEPEALWHLFDSAAIFFLPSRAETFGMAILQAMAAECAVVSTVPLPYEGGRTAIDDLETMIRTIQRLATDGDLCRQLGARNREIARGFTWDSFCGTLYKTFQELSCGDGRRC